LASCRGLEAQVPSEGVPMREGAILMACKQAGLQACKPMSLVRSRKRPRLAEEQCGG
jgi:hypothetical protein